MKKNNDLQQTTPLWKAHSKYMEDKVLRMDVPGHKAGKWKNDMNIKLEKTFFYDINSCPEIDKLSNPHGVIDQAHSLFAEAFGADKAHFLINGTTQGIHTMLLATTKPGDTILVPENIHNSTINGIVLLGLKVKFIRPEFSREWGITHNITLSALQKAHLEALNAKVVLLLNPTYFGIVSDLKKISKYCKKQKLILLCDEAHGSHFHFHNQMPLSAMEAKADMSAMSIHKTGGSLTQASALVWNNNLVEDSNVFRAVNVLQSTSANYLLLSSIDVARKQLYINGNEDISKILELSTFAKKELEKIPGVDVLEDKHIAKQRGAFTYDKTKIILKMDRLGISGFSIYETLHKKYKIQVELGEFKVILLIISPADSKNEILHFVKAIKEISENHKSNLSPEVRSIHKNLYLERQMVHDIRIAFFKEVEEIDWKNAENRIAGETFMTYPPGIPLLLPGQLVTKKHIKYYKWLIKRGASIVSNASSNSKIIVLKEEK